MLTLNKSEWALELLPILKKRTSIKRTSISTARHACIRRRGRKVVSMRRRATTDAHEMMGPGGGKAEILLLIHTGYVEWLPHVHLFCLGEVIMVLPVAGQRQRKTKELPVPVLLARQVFCLTWLKYVCHCPGYWAVMSKFSLWLWKMHFLVCHPNESFTVL